MKLCYLALGASIHTQRWVNYFVDRGCEVHLISDAPYNYKSLNAHVLKTYTMGKGVGFNKSRFINLLIWAAQIRGIIKKINPDILHSHYVSSYGSLGICSGFHPIVISAWGSDILIEPRKSKVLKQIVKSVLRRADLITCDAEHIKEQLLHLGAESRKIKLVYHGTDTRAFNPGQRDKKLREKLGTIGSPIVISLRRFEPIYDIESLITAVPTVLKQVPEAKFVIAGCGSIEGDLKRLTESLGALDSVKFVGEIPNIELPPYLASADIYVSTSLSDAGLAASTAEAMACGLPVIITDLGDNRKWVDDGVNGFIIPLKDPKSLAEKIIYLLKNPDVRMKFGKINRKIIEERNNYYKEMEKMENIYKELIERYKL